MQGTTPSLEKQEKKIYKSQFPDRYLALDENLVP
jgi:hypothetical protein